MATWEHGGGGEQTCAVSWKVEERENACHIARVREWFWKGKARLLWRDHFDSESAAC